MSHVLVRFIVVAAVLVCAAAAQSSTPCSCGSNPPGQPPSRSMKPYTGAPDDLRPFSRYTPTYFENYHDIVEYNGAARDLLGPDLKYLAEIRIGFIGPLYDHPDQALGNRMLNGAVLAIEEANATGGYSGKSLKLM